MISSFRWRQLLWFAHVFLLGNLVSITYEQFAIYINKLVKFTS